MMVLGQVLFASSLTVMLITSSALASDDLSKSIGKFVYKGGNLNGVLNGQERRGFASAVDAYCSRGRNYVPSLTPDEQKWLESELNASTERLNAAVRTEVFARWQLASLYDDCVSWARAIAQLPLEQNGEIYLWAGLVNVAMDAKPSDYTWALVQRSMPPKFAEDADAVMQMIRGGAMRRVILPLTKPKP